MLCDPAIARDVFIVLIYILMAVAAGVALVAIIQIITGRD